jgi:hypothetical protein
MYVLVIFKTSIEKFLFKSFGQVQEDKQARIESVYLIKIKSFFPNKLAGTWSQ